MIVLRQSEKETDAAHMIIRNGIKMRRIAVAMMLTAAMLITGALPVFAVGNVSYEGQSEGFVFAPGSNDAATDLFPEFKHVLPGDSLTDRLDLRNNSSGSVKIYLRAEGADPGSEAFLNQMQLDVKAEGGRAIFTDAAGKTSGLDDWVLLGTLPSGEKTTLDMNLKVPIEMGDDFQDAIGYVNWQFKVEEIEDETVSPEKPSDSTNPSEPSEPEIRTEVPGEVGTGDRSKIVVLILMTAAAMGIIALLIRRRLER